MVVNIDCIEYTVKVEFASYNLYYVFSRIFTLRLYPMPSTVCTLNK